jgi:uncharacterized protein YqeY
VAAYLCSVCIHIVPKIFMSLTETLACEMKAAMLNGDKLRLDTLRSIRALVLEFEKSGAGRAITPDDEVRMLTTAAKKRRDAIEAYAAAGRTDAADREAQELNIIMEFLPKQMSDDEVLAELRSIVTSQGFTSPSDLGKLMGAAMKTLKGKADGSTIQRIAKGLLGG